MAESSGVELDGLYSAGLDHASKGSYPSFVPVTQSAVVWYYNNCIQYTAGIIIYTVNGQEREMDALAYVDNGAFMLCPRFLCEPLGFSYSWEAATHTICICFPYQP